MGHVKLTLSSELLDARNEELATGHRVYWPIKVPANTLTLTLTQTLIPTLTLTPTLIVTLTPTLIVTLTLT